MNYCIIFDNQKIAIEIPLSSESNRWTDVERYIIDNLTHFTTVVNGHGLRKIKEGVDYVPLATAKRWGHSIISL